VARGAGWNGRLVTVAAAGALAVLLASAPPGTGAVGDRSSPHDTLRTRQAALARAQQRALLDLYAYEIRLTRARASLAGVEQRIDRLGAERAQLRRRAVVVRHSLLVARERLVHALRTLYKQGQPDPVAILLGAGSFDEAVAGLDGLRRTARANRRLIGQLQRTEQRLHGLDRRLHAKRRALQRARRDAERRVADLTRVTNDRAAALASVRTRLSLTHQELDRLDRVARTAQRRSVTLTAHSQAVLSPQAAESPAAAPARAPRLPAPGATTTLVVDAVAYHLPGRTASGLPVGKGVVAVDPSVIPLGTRMFVPGYGSAVAADVGSAVKGSLIDLWMPSRARALAWGRRTVTITIYG
jgi:3D (Asp-Asp-Asp) domain-containing protein